MTPDRWYCTWCGDEHQRDIGTLVDDRYAVGNCAGNQRPLVRDEAEARRLSRVGGKHRPKGTPIGGRGGNAVIQDKAGRVVR